MSVTGKKYVHEALVNRLGGLSLPRKSVVRLTDCPDMTLDVYRGPKTTIKQQQQSCCKDTQALIEKEHSSDVLRSAFEGYEDLRYLKQCS